MINTLAGLVVQEQSGFFWVETPTGDIYMCRLRGRLLEQAQSADIAAIGDRVQITVVDAKTGTIESVEPRKSILSRALRTEGNRGAGAAEREQVIIANADQALFVFAAAQPAPSLRMLDRFLVVGEKSSIDNLVVILNKVDLDGAASIIAHFDLYAQIGYKVLHTSALRNEGIDELRELLKDRISVFTGPSGVGKSSLLNQVQPGLARSVRNVSQTRHEGLHTTRDSVLVKLKFGGYLADTPGIRTLNSWDVEPEELDAYFREIAPRVAACRFADCSHRNEPGCEVRAALAEGKISHSRYKSYCSIREELEAAFDAMY